MNTSSHNVKKFHRIWLRSEKLKRENKSLLIAAQDSAIRTNYMKQKKCRITIIGYVVAEMKLLISL